MSKFAAWAQGWTSNNHGIRLQTFSVRADQQRQFLGFTVADTYYSGLDVHVSSTVPWPTRFGKTNIIDQDPKQHGRASAAPRRRRTSGSPSGGVSVASTASN